VPALAERDTRDLAALRERGKTVVGRGPVRLSFSAPWGRGPDRGASSGSWGSKGAAAGHGVRRAELLDLDDCAVDGSHIRALKGGMTSVPRPSAAPAPAPSTT
jgi:hypothetical protein